jgi:TonB family protein
MSAGRALAAACAAAALLASAAIRAGAQDSPTLRPRGAEQPIERPKAAEDSVERKPPEEQAFSSYQALPEPLVYVAPVYPARARVAGIQGTVVLHVRVRRDGTTEEPRVARSVPELDQAAIRAVRGWSWKPARGEDGKPVDAEVAVPVRFLRPVDSGTDWSAERRLALALERDGRGGEAFERYVLALRALPDGAPADTLHMLRRDVLRARPRNRAGPAVTGPDVTPIEALVHRQHADSLARAGDWSHAADEYRSALGFAPWRWEWYRPFAEAEARAGRPAAAADLLELYLLGDVPAADRASERERIARLRAPGGR